MADGAKQPPAKRDLERALTAAGLSARQAKTPLAKGYSGIADAQAEAAEDLADLAAELARRLRAG